MNWRLSPEQKTQFEEQGYLLVSGLIPPDVVARAKEQLQREAEEKSVFGSLAANPFPGFVVTHNMTAQGHCGQLDCLRNVGNKDYE